MLSAFLAQRRFFDAVLFCSQKLHGTLCSGQLVLCFRALVGGQCASFFQERQAVFQEYAKRGDGA